MPVHDFHINLDDNVFYIVLLQMSNSKLDYSELIELLAPLSYR